MLSLPTIMMGTSGLGNLYKELPIETKVSIVDAFIKHADSPPVFDTAGKYGAGLALECLGHALSALNVPPAEVVISNKLGWLRVPLEADEPTFEPGVWKNLKYDAIQKIGYEEILECYEQGNLLLGNYNASLVSVHDPDEYMSRAVDKSHEENLYEDILLAYKALLDLKKMGHVKAVGVGAKDWRIIRRLSGDIAFDWVMFANSYTIHNHPQELGLFMHELYRKGVFVINSAVFNGGFLTGSDFYNYKLIDKESSKGKAMYAWRSAFFDLCKKYDLNSAAVCVKFGLAAPGVKGIALNTTRPEQVPLNIKMKDIVIPPAFWVEFFAL